MTVEREPSTIDDYLEGVPEDRRRVLEDLRATIRIPAFRLNGVVVAGFCDSPEQGKLAAQKGAAENGEYLGDDPSTNLDRSPRTRAGALELRHRH